MRRPELIVRSHADFIRLKGVRRAGWALRGVEPAARESVADHSLGVAALVMLLADGHGPRLDSARALRMALIHDLGEARVGDLTPSDGVSADEKHRQEAAAFRDIVEGLPDRDAMVELFEEYEAGETAEARFVRQVDKLEMALQAAHYRAQGHDGLEEFFQSARDAIDDPDLLAILDAAQRR